MRPAACHKTAAAPATGASAASRVKAMRAAVDEEFQRWHDGQHAAHGTGATPLVSQVTNLLCGAFLNRLIEAEYHLMGLFQVVLDEPSEFIGVVRGNFYQAFEIDWNCGSAWRL
jgi:hypothetical protein